MNLEAILCLSALAVLIVAWLGYAAGIEGESGDGFTGLFVVMNFVCIITIVTTIGVTLVEAWFR